MTISSYGFLAGVDPELTVSGPTAPFDIPVGTNVTLEVSFVRSSAPTHTQGLLGCLFDPSPDPACLGEASESIASDLVDAVFDQQ